ncbi:hypothetical protein D9758_009399 [Tetrapyrgos nigripes]|uniref:HMG box domain-containing protein n=1 Tax=Tetrapyrgos nigripes TaxID=182062 RepID=A0A8H5FWS5_9AGAR|nr:hypothetical protein D9758_009399 [Tetrapyrgos nigripes]
MSFTDDKAYPSSSIGSFNHLSSANFSQNRINTVGRDLHETHHHNYYQIIEDSKGWRIKTMGSGILKIGQTVIQGITGLLYGSGSSPSIETTTQESIETLEELFNGTDYRVHSARHKGRSVLVKVFHGPRAKEHQKAAISFNERLLHPSMLRMMACSPSSSQAPFIIFDDECERGSVDYCVASALTDGLPRSVMLGFQLIGGLSAGLDYLSTVIDVPLSTVGRDNYEVYITNGNQVKIGLGCYKTGRHGEDGSEADWVLFNDLCSKLFNDANRLLYKEDIDRNEASIAEDTEADEEPNPQFQPSPFVSHSSSDFPDSLSSSTMITPRRELQWTRSPQVSTLASVSRRYRDHLRMSPYHGALDLRRLNAKRRFEVISHRCQGYRKEEITFTSEIKECAVVLHTMPFRGEICLDMRREIVTEGVFRCICANLMMDRQLRLDVPIAMRGSIGRVLSIFPHQHIIIRVFPVNRLIQSLNLPRNPLSDLPNSLLLPGSSTSPTGSRDNKLPIRRKLNVAQAAKEAGAEYTSLSAEEKEPYKRRSQQMKEAREREHTAYMRTLTPEDIKRENAFRAAQRKAGKSRKPNIKDPNAPKKPLSAYFMFLQRIRSDPYLVKQVFGEETETTKQSVLAAARWRSMTDEERKPFLAQAEQKRWSMKLHVAYMKKAPQVMEPVSASVFYPEAVLSPTTSLSRPGQRARVTRVIICLRRRFLFRSFSFYATPLAAP